MCFSSLFLSTKYQKIDDLLFVMDFPRFFGNKQTLPCANLGGFHGLINVADENHSE